MELVAPARACYQKRVVEFPPASPERERWRAGGEWLCQEMIKAIPHRHFIFSIPWLDTLYY